MKTIVTIKANRGSTHNSNGSNHFESTDHVAGGSEKKYQNTNSGNDHHTGSHNGTLEVEVSDELHDAIVKAVEKLPEIAASWAAAQLAAAQTAKAPQPVVDAEFDQ